MKIFAFIILWMTPLCGWSLLAQQEAHAPDMQAAMAVWQAAGTPGEAHGKLDYFVGSWDIASKIIMGTGQPLESKGTAEFRWALDGRFLEQDMRGEMMGTQMTGKGYIGYDNLNKKYTSFWIDNTGTAMYNAEGFVDRSGKMFTWFGKMDEATTGEYDKNVKYVARIVNDQTFVYEIHDLVIGEPNTKVVEMTYTRRK